MGACRASGRGGSRRGPDKGEDPRRGGDDGLADEEAAALAALLCACMVSEGGATVGRSPCTPEMSVRRPASTGTSKSPSSSAQRARFFSGFPSGPLPLLASLPRVGNSSSRFRCWRITPGGATATALQGVRPPDRVPFQTDGLFEDKFPSFGFAVSRPLGFSLPSVSRESCSPRSSLFRSSSSSSFGRPQPQPPAGTNLTPGSWPSFSDLRLPS